MMLKSPNVKEEQKTCNLATVDDCIEETQPENGIYITYILRDFAKIELTIENMLKTETWSWLLTQVQIFYQKRVKTHYNLKLLVSSAGAC